VRFWWALLAPDATAVWADGHLLAIGDLRPVAVEGAPILDAQFTAVARDHVRLAHLLRPIAQPAHAVFQRAVGQACRFPMAHQRLDYGAA
jgi:hypothetical protein